MTISFVKTKYALLATLILGFWMSFFMTKWIVGRRANNRTISSGGGSGSGSGVDDEFDWLSKGKDRLQFRSTEPQQQQQQQQPIGGDGDGDGVSIGERYVFKILQIADVHMGEAEDTAWGPRQDRDSARVISKMLEWEDPDLVVLSGDQLTANNIDANATLYYQNLIQIMQTANPDVRWCMIFGNHDDQPLDENRTQPAKTSRLDLINLDRSYSNSYTGLHPENTFGVSNYRLPLYKRNIPALDLYFFDTGGGSLPQKIDSTQIDWFRQQSLLTNADNNKNNLNPQQQPRRLPAVAFQHIPSPEFTFHPQHCTGENKDNGFAPIQSDAGIVNALIQHGNVHFLAVGHNHGNDYCCPISSSPTSTSSSSSLFATEEERNITKQTSNQNKNILHLCFGRHSGHGGYGRWERGSRVYELEFQTSNNDIDNEDGSHHHEDSFSWRSWVRLEFGAVIDMYQPFGQ